MPAASALLGAEYGFAKNQSIGIDGFIEGEESSEDNVQDTAGVTHNFGKFWHSWERAVFLNYRYYLGFQRLRQKKGIAPYLLAFLRYGKIDAVYDPLYPLSGYYRNHERHYSTGILIGATFCLKGADQGGLDVNFGLFEKEKVINTAYLTHGVETSVNSKPVGLGFRLSVNLVVWFEIRKKAT